MRFGSKLAGAVLALALLAPAAQAEQLVFGEFRAEKLGSIENLSLNRFGVTKVTVRGTEHDLTIVRAEAIYNNGEVVMLDTLRGEVELGKPDRVATLPDQLKYEGVDSIRITASSSLRGSRGKYKVLVDITDLPPPPRPQPRPPAPRPEPVYPREEMTWTTNDLLSRIASFESLTLQIRELARLSRSLEIVKLDAEDLARLLQSPVVRYRQVVQADNRLYDSYMQLRADLFVSLPLYDAMALEAWDQITYDVQRLGRLLNNGQPRRAPMPPAPAPAPVPPAPPAPLPPSGPACEIVEAGTFNYRSYAYRVAVNGNVLDASNDLNEFLGKVARLREARVCDSLPTACVLEEAGTWNYRSYKHRVTVGKVLFWGGDVLSDVLTTTQTLKNAAICTPVPTEPCTLAGPGTWDYRSYANRVMLGNKVVYGSNDINVAIGTMSDLRKANYCY